MGGTMNLEVSKDTTLAILKDLILERTGIPTWHQRVRFGYPPRVLQGISPFGSACQLAMLFYVMNGKRRLI